MPLQVQDEISSKPYSLTEVKPNIDNQQIYFSLSDKDNSIEIYVDYILTPYSNYQPEDYSLFLFKSFELNSENNIFQVFEKEFYKEPNKIRLGWIFPLQALLSNQHLYADNPHFLKYAYVAFLKLLKTEHDYTTKIPSYKTTNNYKLTDFYGDDNSIIILILSNTSLLKIGEFNIDNYVTSLYSYSYYFCQPNEELKKNNNRADCKIPDGNNLILQKNSQYLQGEDYLYRLFKSSLRIEEHPLVRFYLLYQVIELMIDIVFETIFLNKINDFNSQKADKNIYKLKESIQDISNEKKRISKLLTALETHFDGDNKTNLLNCCNQILVAFNNNEENTLADALYTVRNLIVHKFRNLPENDLPKIKKLNKEFENIVITIILNYQPSLLDRMQGYF